MPDNGGLQIFYKGKEINSVWDIKDRTMQKYGALSGYVIDPFKDLDKAKQTYPEGYKKPVSLYNIDEPYTEGRETITH